MRILDLKIISLFFSFFFSISCFANHTIFIYGAEGRYKKKDMKKLYNNIANKVDFVAFWPKRTGKSIFKKQVKECFFGLKDKKFTFEDGLVNDLKVDLLHFCNSRKKNILKINLVVIGQKISFVKKLLKVPSFIHNYNEEQYFWHYIDKVILIDLDFMVNRNYVDLNKRSICGYKVVTASKALNSVSTWKQNYTDTNETSLSKKIVLVTTDDIEEYLETFQGQKELEKKSKCSWRCVGDTVGLMASIAGVVVAILAL